MDEHLQSSENKLEELDGAREQPEAKQIELVHLGQAASRGIGILPPEKDVEKPLKELLNKTREQLIGGLESNEKGLNIARVREYIQSYGLRADTQVVALNGRNYKKFKQRLVDSGQGDTHEHDGMYIQGVDLIVVRRSRRLEWKLGTGITEYIIAHELAHASARKETYNYIDKEENGDVKGRHMSPGRAGQVIYTPEGEREGGYLEEILPESIAQQYRRYVLRKPNGFSKNAKPRRVETALGYVEIPAEYLIDRHFGPQTFAKMGLDCLQRYDPTLADSLVKARMDPKGLQEVASKISAIGRQVGEPDLYRKIRTTRYSNEDFAHLTRKLVDLLEPRVARKWDYKYGIHGSKPRSKEAYEQEPYFDDVIGDQLVVIDRRATQLNGTLYKRPLNLEEQTELEQLRLEREKLVGQFHDQKRSQAA